MNTGQFSKADSQNHNEEQDSGEKTQKPGRLWLLYGIGLVTVIAILVICVFLIFTCKIPIFNNLLPFCPKPIITPPTITKIFSPNSIEVNEVSTLTFTLGNSNSFALTGVTFTDALPSGLQVVDLPSATTTCSGEPTWAPSAGTMTLVFGSPTGGTISAHSSCLVNVSIRGTNPGSYQNVSGYVSSANGGSNTSSTGSATASITVNQTDGVTPPNLAESFVPDQIPSTNTSTLTFAITNPNTSDTLTGVAFSNIYPNGLTNTAPLSTTNNCGGTLTADAGGKGVSLSDGTIPAATICTVTVDVTAPNEGSYSNISVVVSSTNGGTGSVASDTLYVGIVPPEASIRFLKEISTSVDGPWMKFISVNPGTNIYYKFTIENLGNTPFYQFYVTDPAVNTAGCFGILPEASSGNNIAKCVVGPIAAESGIHANTATASGTYAEPYTTAPSTATYVTTSQTSLDLYLPEPDTDTQRKFGLQIQGQLDVFNGANVGVVINIKYYSDAQSLMKGNASGVIALPSKDVSDFAEHEFLLPISALPDNRDYLADARESVTVNEQLFAYPWQREVCSPNYLNLAISAQLPADVVVIANKLGDFLTSEANQRMNFDAWQVYPTLNSFYHSESTFPEVSCSAVDKQATDRAEELVNVLSEKFSIYIQPSLAKGLDATTIGRAPGELAGTITPAIDGNQKYKGREVKGTFSINNSLLTLDMLNLINKGTLQVLPLPMGNYILACITGPNKDCLAVSIDQGIEYQIDPDIISDGENETLVNIPFARYEQGSYKKCYYVAWRWVCIRVFK